MTQKTLQLMRLMILSFLFLLGACSNGVERPESVPADAVYWKSGNLLLAGSTVLWMSCDEHSANLDCKVWDQSGRLFQHGKYRFLSAPDGCFPTFLTTRFRYRGGYLLPIDVLDDQGITAYGSVQHDEALQEAIFRVAKHRFGFQLSNYEVVAQSNAENGTYRASTDDGKFVVSGRFWCAEVFSAKKAQLRE